MAFLRKKSHRPQVSIQLTPRSTDGHFYATPDHFLSNETINGSAVVQLPPSVEFSHCKIVLKGSINTTTEESTKGAMGKAWRSEHLQFLGVFYNTKARHGRQCDNGSVKVPFHFDLNECQSLVKHISALPPSLDSRLEGQRVSDCQYDIAYSITVTVHSTSSTLASSTQKISILPVSPDALSAHPSNVPNEYHWAESVIKQPKRVHANGPHHPSGPKIEIAGQEPDSIVFDPEDSIPSGSTRIPFVVKVSPQNTDGECLLPTQCAVKARLITKTHITPDGMRKIGSNLDFVRTGGNHVTRSHVSVEQESLVPLSRWEECRSSTTEPFSIAHFSFDFSIGDGKTHMPNFFSPLLSRRYFLELSLSFPDKANEVFKLTLPVDLVHGVIDASSDDERKPSKSSVVSTVEARL